MANSKVQEFSPIHRNKGGRPKNSRAAKNDPSRIIRKIIPMTERVKLLAELARGVTVVETNQKGDTKTYTKPPDEKAIRQLNEYDHGKPVDRSKIDVTSGGEKLSAIALIPPILHPKKQKDSD
jgi:squalene cyclase